MSESESLRLFLQKAIIERCGVSKVCWIANDGGRFPCLYRIDLRDGHFCKRICDILKPYVTIPVQQQRAISLYVDGRVGVPLNHLIVYGIQVDQ